MNESRLNSTHYLGASKTKDFFSINCLNIAFTVGTVSKTSDLR